ncbi:MAG TPA: hypothetical protein PKL13_03420 [bacterium]|nr:hypothetical protein [bacterium]
MITSRDPEGIHAVNLFAAVYDKSRLDKYQAQRFNENCGAFQKEVAELIRKYSIINQHVDEEMDSNYGYLSGYKPKNIIEQIDILCQLFPGIDCSHETFVENQLPHNAEGWFAIPRWQKIAPTYGEAVQKVLDIIRNVRNGAFYNYYEGKLGSQYLRQSQKSIEAFQKFFDDQGGRDILVIPAQLGLRHRGRSFRRALEVMNANEFGLGVFSVGIIILTHPERLMNYDDLWIDCVGDEFSAEYDNDFCRAPYFMFSGDWIYFGVGFVNVVNEHYGSASAFFPEQ